VASKPPKSLSQIIDHIERIREELLVLQNDLQKMEPAKRISRELKSGSDSRVRERDDGPENNCGEDSKGDGQRSFMPFL
jgi:hypothetical protein